MTKVRSTARGVWRSGVLSLPASAIAFALWLKKAQLAFVNASLIANYPLAWWAEACLLMTLVFFALWLPLRWAQSFQPNRQRRAWFARAHALAFLVLCLVWVSLPLRAAVLLFLAVQIALLGFELLPLRRRWKIGGLRSHACALGVILAAHVLFQGFLSPLNWRNPPIAYTGESMNIACQTALFRIDYVNAKRLDYSHFDYSLWGTAPQSPIAGSSLIVPFTAFLLDLPTLDIIDYHLLVHAFAFLLLVGASFAFYLFLRFGLELDWVCSLVGGIFYTLVNCSFAYIHGHHFPAFSGLYLVLPWALLLYRLAWARNDPRLALGSGLALASNFYVFPPHPDPILHGVVFFFLYAAWLAGRKGFRFFLGAAAGFIGGAAHYLWPLLLTQILGDQHVFGHREALFFDDKHLTYLKIISPLISCQGLLLALGLAQAHRLYRSSVLGRDFRFFAAFALLGLIAFSCGKDGPLPWLLRSTSSPLSFLFIQRIFSYVELSILLVALMGLHSASREKSFAKPLLRAVMAATALIGAIAVVWRSSHGVAELLKPWLALTVLCQGGLAFAILSRGFKRAPRAASMAATAASVIFACALAWRSPARDHIASAEETENPRHCPVFLSLQADAVNERGLKFDPANLEYLRKRLMSFESDLDAYNGPDREAIRARYTEGLRPTGATTALSLPEEALPEAALSVGFLVDAFYLERSGQCFYLSRSPGPGGEHVPGGSRSEIFRNAASPLERIHSVPEMYWGNFGLAHGFLLNNGTASLAPQFMTAFPPLHALYLQPGETRDNVGHYVARFGIEGGVWMVSRSDLRKLLNIAGIDIYALNRRDYAGVPNKEGLSELVYETPERIDPRFAVVRDTRSRGLAYFADSVRFVEPISERFRGLKMPFPSPESPEARTYSGLVDLAIRELVGLDTPAGILLERGPALADAVADMNPGEILERALVGNKSAFRVRCSDTPCRFVLNMADLRGWNAFMDDWQAPIERANYAFMSIKVRKGEHLVWFEYHRAADTLATIVTLLALLLPWLGFGDWALYRGRAGVTLKT